MRRRLVIGSLVALALVWVLPAGADDMRSDEEMDVTMVDEDVDESEMKFRVTGQVRARYEYLWDYLEQSKDVNTNFDIAPYRAQIGVLGRFTDNVYGYIDLQAFGAFGDSIPDSSSQNSGSQALDTDFLEATTVQLYQGFVDMKEIGGSNFDVRVGRAEHIIGNELHMGNNDFYNGLTFDGARGWYDGGDRWDVGAYFYWAVERNTPVGNPLGVLAGPCSPDVIVFPCTTSSLNPSNTDARVAGADFTWTFDQETGHYITGYAIQNTSRLEASFGGAGDHELNTVGLLWKRDVAEERGFDWSAEAATQFGSITTTGNPDVDFGGYIVEGWLGYKLAGAHRFRLGGLLASGVAEDDASDEFNGWVPLFTDYHQDNRLGNLDLFNGTLYTNGVVPSSPGFGGIFGPVTFLTMSNVTNLNLRYEYERGKSYALIAVHDFQFTEELDPTGVNISDIGQELDLLYRYQRTKHLTWEVAYSYFLPGDWYDEIYSPDDPEEISRFWIQAALQW
ncbi:MAG TPA: alginate export family protein [Candidatus Polarisedimenticolaceae bacterium]|nr:alginate export family protein [Candidatus Polarisedimenticolaceae bacterium]